MHLTHRLREDPLEKKIQGHKGHEVRPHNGHKGMPSYFVFEADLHRALRVVYFVFFVVLYFKMTKSLFV
jgi:hypothetical protein